MNSTRGRRLSALVVAAVLTAILVGPVVGGGSSTVITNTIAGTFVRQGAFGLIPTTCGDVGVELVPDPLPIPWIWSTAFEFALPAGATIVSASLSLRDADGNLPDPILIHGYAGDGFVTTADMTKTAGTPVTYTPTGTGYESHDVTALIGQAAVSSGWAGFLLNAETVAFDTVHHHFDCPEDAQPALLSITFALPDAAMGNPVAPNSLPVVGFGLLLIGSMIGLSAVRVTRSR